MPISSSFVSLRDNGLPFVCASPVSAISIACAEASLNSAHGLVYDNLAREQLPVVYLLVIYF